MVGKFAVSWFLVSVTIVLVTYSICLVTRRYRKKMRYRKHCVCPGHADLSAVLTASETNSTLVSVKSKAVTKWMLQVLNI